MSGKSKKSIKARRLPTDGTKTFVSVLPSPYEPAGLWGSAHLTCDGVVVEVVVTAGTEGSKVVAVKEGPVGVVVDPGESARLRCPELLQQVISARATPRKQVWTPPRNRLAAFNSSASPPSRLDNSVAGAWM
jgi:hypothetical protein